MYHYLYPAPPFFLKASVFALGSFAGQDGTASKAYGKRYTIRNIIQVLLPDHGGKRPPFALSSFGAASHSWFPEDHPPVESHSRWVCSAKLKITLQQAAGNLPRKEF